MVGHGSAVAIAQCGRILVPMGADARGEGGLRSGAGTFVN